MDCVGSYIDTVQTQPWTEALTPAPKLSAILLVDNRDENLTALRVLFEGDGRGLLTARSAAEAHSILQGLPVDLVILEARDPSAADFCHQLRLSPLTRLIPLVILSEFPARELEIACIGAGADVFRTRPYPPEVLCAQVRSLLRRKSAVDLLEESETILLALAQAIEKRDNLAAGHCERLAALSVAMGMAMDLPHDQLLALQRGGYLHDVGKIGMPDSILFKPGPLTAEEWIVMRRHTVKGEEICRPIKCLAPALPIVRSHHERWDGSGYPDGLSGERIPLLARVLQFADIYDALTATRSYKSSMKRAAALRVLQEETDRGWRDPELMRVFRRLKHENLRAAAERYAREWQDVQVMKASLENLSSSIRLG